MSILFGIRHPGDQEALERELKILAGPTARDVLEGPTVCARPGIGMGYQPLSTHPRSKLDSQPVSDVRNHLLTFDGRLDNHRELCASLEIQDRETPDSIIVLVAFERWGEECFGRFVGDWAIALWSARNQALYLARDHAGTRTLYYRGNDERMTWSNRIDTIISGDWKNNADIDNVFAAAYLLGQPARGHTPYEGILTVPAGCYMVFRNDRVLCQSHWRWMDKGEISYRTESEYVDHFLALFRSAIERRTQPGFPILAELSGGMDSSSIVCMSDHMRLQSGSGPDGLIDTISYLDDSEPEWNERPYVAAVEAQRRRTGIHVTRTFSEYLFSPISAGGDGLYPGADRAFREREQFLEEILGARGYHIVLSGIGGDEVLGGVPMPTPELADYLVQGKFHSLMKQMIAWSLSSQTPALSLLTQTFRHALHAYVQPEIGFPVPPWVRRHAVDTYKSCNFKFNQHRCKVGIRPSRYHAALAWVSVTETLERRHPLLSAHREYRYPYLDKDLVEFLLRVPRSRLVRPGRRRALMRNALKGIVPEEVLERKQKGVVVRTPLIALEQRRRSLSTLFSQSLLGEMQYIDSKRFLEIVDSALVGDELAWLSNIARTIYLELWLQRNRPYVGESVDSGEPPVVCST